MEKAYNLRARSEFTVFFVIKLRKKSDAQKHFNREVKKHDNI